MTVLDDNSLWWWPEPGTEYEHEFAEETLRVVRQVASRAAQTTYAGSDMALVVDDLESWLVSYTFNVRESIDGGTLRINQEILDQWCRLLYSILLHATEWYLSYNHPAGLTGTMDAGQLWGRAKSTRSTDEPVRGDSDNPGAVVGDFGRALWASSGEPTDPARHLTTLETIQEAIERLTGAPCGLGWEDALTELDRLVGEPKAGQCAELGCKYPPLSGKKGSKCQYHSSLAYYQNTGICTVSGCEARIRARGMCTRHYEAERKREAPPCIEDGCEKPQHARGVCASHYQQQRASGEIQRIVNSEAPAYLQDCTVVGCGRRQYARGLCKSHYRQDMKTDCAEPGCPKRSHTRGLCSRHYREQMQREGALGKATPPERKDTPNE